MITRMTASRRWLPWLAVATIVTAVCLFFAFFVSSGLLHGDALNGHVVNGHYFVANHGAYTEVSESDWNLNHTLGLAMMTIWPLGMISAAFLLFRYVFPFLMTGGVARPASPQVAMIERSSALRWSGSPGGRVGGVNFTRAMLGVEVYADGLILRPRFMTPIAIDADAITFVTSAWRMSPMIEIRHASPDAQSPIFLYGRRTSDLGRAIDALVRDRQPAAGSTDSDGVTAGGTRAESSVPAAPQRPPWPMRALSILGFVVGFIMLGIGVFEVIPKFGPFGFAWTGLIAVVLVSNLRRFLRKGW